MINVILKAHFPQMKPAHHADIAKQGSGSNLDRAIRDAVQNVFTDERLKGKRYENILPARFTVNIFQKVQEDDE
jgi:hypothetical protein